MRGDPHLINSFYKRFNFFHEPRPSSSPHLIISRQQTIQFFPKVFESGLLGVAQRFIDAEDTTLLALIGEGVPIATKQLESPDGVGLEDGLLTLALRLRGDEEDGLANDLGFLCLRPRSNTAPFNGSIRKDGSGNGKNARQTRRLRAALLDKTGGKRDKKIQSQENLDQKRATLKLHQKAKICSH